MSLPDSSILSNMFVTGVSNPDYGMFEKKYIIIRSMENRLYTDEELCSLPEISPAHPHYGEWQVRKHSAQRLVRYFTAKEKPLRILEIGCGNGWLCHQLSRIPGARITGLDINFTELQQAARVFSDVPNLNFVNGDLTASFYRPEADMIVFASSIQYFSPLRKIIQLSLQRLSAGGEIHILDTHFYHSDKVALAKRKTADYFASLGFPEMSDFYFHHEVQSLLPFKPRFLYNPLALKNRFLRNRDPFPWICIKK